MTVPKTQNSNLSFAICKRPDKILVKLSRMLFVVWLMASAPAYALDSCEKYAAWVKPLQDNATRNNRGRLKLPPIRNGVQAFEAYRLVFEDGYFVPYFGQPFDELSRRQRTRIYNKIQRIGNRCNRRSEPDIQFYVGLSPRIDLAAVFSERDLRGRGGGYAMMAAHVASARVSIGQDIGAAEEPNLAAQTSTQEQVLASNVACETVTELDFTDDSEDWKKNKYSDQVLSPQALYDACKLDLEGSTGALAHTRYAKALYLLGIRRREILRPSIDSWTLRLFRSDEVDLIVKHTEIAARENEPMAYLFLDVLKSKAFPGSYEHYCGLHGQCSVEALKLDPDSGYAQRKVREAWDSAMRWRNSRREDLEPVDFSGQRRTPGKIAADSKARLISSSDALFDLAKQMHAIFGAEYAYTLAVMSVRDFRTDIMSSQILDWLEEARPVSAGLSEALEAELYEANAILSGQAMSEEISGRVAILWRESAAKGNPYAQMRVLLDTEAPNLNEEQLFDRFEAFSTEYPQAAGPINSWHTTIWIIKTKYELNVNLGPLAFRRATALVQENSDAVPSEQAIKYYDMASRLGIQRASIAMGYFYRDGRGVPQDDVDAQVRFGWASRGRPEPRLGELSFDPKLARLALDEDRELDPYADRSSAISSTDLLMAIGLVALFLGSANPNVGAQYTPSATSYEPPPLEIWQYLALFNPTGEPR